MVQTEHSAYPAARPDARSSRYTIRYRCRNRAGRVALLVEDSRGAIYLFSGGSLQARWAGQGARARLGQLVAGKRGWDSVPRVAPYSIAELRQLTGIKE